MNIHNRRLCSRSVPHPASALLFLLMLEVVRYTGRAKERYPPKEFSNFLKNYKEVYDKILPTGYSFNYP